ncbi:MAG: hypothetical protein DRG31_07885, partial [Deltaproteobacteria bacterium]
MKILQVVHGFPPRQRAGTEIYTYYLSKELAKRHEVHVFYPTLENVKEPILVSFNQEGLILHELKLPRSKVRRFLGALFFENTYINREAENAFKTMVASIRPNVIHFQHLIGLSATLIKIAREFNVPTVLTLHDYWFMCPNIQLLRHDYTVCIGPEPRRCHKCWIKRRSEEISELLNSSYGVPQSLARKSLRLVLETLNSPRKFIERENYMKALLLKVDRIIAPSKFVRKLFIDYGVPEDKITYSENGYDLRVFEGFKKKNKYTDRIVFGFVGGVSKHKGVHILIDAFMNIPDKKAELRIYGDYNPKSTYVREILSKAKKNIKFIGRFEDVREPYSEIDVLVAPSIWPETGGP